MSALWDVEVIRIEDRKVDLLVGFRHPDAGPFSTAPQFALRLLYDQAWKYDDQFRSIAAGELAETISPAEIEDDNWLTNNVQNYIVSVTLSDVKRVPFDEEVTQELINQQVQTQGISPTNKSEWQRAWNSCWEAFWQDTSNLPVATYTVIVTDAKWLSHLTLNQRWDSAAYE
jgi:hypothetical protein